MSTISQQSFTVDSFAGFVGRIVSVGNSGKEGKYEGSGLCVAFHKTESGFDVELSSGHRFGFTPQSISDAKVCGLVFKDRIRNVSIIPFEGISKIEATEMARFIVKSAKSADEIRRRLSEVGFNGERAAITTHSSGSSFIAMAMMYSPDGEVISV